MYNGIIFFSDDYAAMRKWMWLISLLSFLYTPICLSAEKALVLEINGAIGPATQDYVSRGIQYAEKEQFAAVILQLNTPGGLETAMRGINAAIMTSRLPIIAYVAPAGARAASAGTFILYASHIAAMAPGTNVGAASPVNLLKSSDSKALTTEEKKAINDAAAYLRSLAELRGRNATWADSAVKNGESLSATEAKRLNVIDVIADNYPDLLAKINGRTIMIHGVPDKLDTKQMTLKTLPADWRHDLLAFITNPNVAYILMLVAIYGLFFEFSSPGLVLPGVAGVIALLLVLYAFQLLPINYAGLTLLLVGITFILFEIYISSFGIVGIGGVIAFILGSIFLFDTQDANYKLALPLILTMSSLSILFFIAILTLAFRSQKKAVITGKEGLIGAEGIVLSIMNQQVVVRISGEIWEARAKTSLKPGQIIKVVDIKGLTLLVEPFKDE